tara:strand:- start:1088 stop:1309 length:222 start_codon:yes stop_codon:yes gene_type:complete
VNSWFRNIIEIQAFGACSCLAEYLNMKASSVRIFFIYSSFLTFGSPLLVYLILMFVFRLKNLVNSKRSSIYDF